MYNVSIVSSNEYRYNDKPSLFRPSKAYPEYPFDKSELSDKNNNTYDSVRKAIALLRLDEQNFNTEKWNPFKDLIKKGDTVLIKPNLVMDVNLNSDGGTDCMYTQPDVVAPVIDYCVIALKGTGKIIIGDAPMQECDFGHLVESSGYKDLIEYYKSKNIDIQIVDFRELKSKVENGVRISSIDNLKSGKVINLGNDSDFYGIGEQKSSQFRITNYDPRIMQIHHTDKKHEYYVSDYVLMADVIINMPKPKSHRKAGVTISLKNMVGINVRKEYLPHHTKGSIQENGDEYLDKCYLHRIRSNLYDYKNILESKRQYFSARLLGKFILIITIVLKMFHINKVMYSEGSWYGNNTISKTIADLNKILYYCDKTGVMQNKVQRKILIVADMIICGEKEGPVLPSKKEVGIIAIGDNPVAFDMVIATIMGFDYNKIPTIKNAQEKNNKYQLFNKDEKIDINSNDYRYNKKKLEDISLNDTFQFHPSKGWKNHLELEK